MIWTSEFVFHFLTHSSTPTPAQAGVFNSAIFGLKAASGRRSAGLEGGDGNRQLSSLFLNSSVFAAMENSPTGSLLQPSHVGPATLNWSHLFKELLVVSTSGLQQLLCSPRELRAANFLLLLILGQVCASSPPPTRDYKLWQQI